MPAPPHGRQPPANAEREHPDAQRRRVLQSMAAGACVLGGLPARAAAEGKVYFGHPPGHVAIRVANLVLKEMQGRYEPDLGTGLTHVLGDSAIRCIEAAHKGAADGSTVLYCANANLTLLPQLLTMPIADVVGGFTPVAPLLELTRAFVVGPAVPADVQTMPQYVRWVRDNHLFGSYGVLGLGSPTHFVGMALAHTTDFPAKALAYQSQQSMRRELLQGVIAGAFMVVGGTPELPADARLRPLAVTSPKRSAALPEVPTLRELGLTDVDAFDSVGFHVPAGTPADKVAALNRAVQQALDSEAVRAVLVDGLLRGSATTPQAYAAALVQEREAWRVVVKRERFTLRG